jgi:hypothetical protein
MWITHEINFNMQGRRKLSKADWESTDVGDTICPHPHGELTDLQKPGWAIAHSVHPSPTSLICTVLKFHKQN